MNRTRGHKSVMVREIIDSLAPVDGGIYVDGTFGAGGHAIALLESADCSLIAIDRDPDAIRRGQSRLLEWQGRARLVEGRFGALKELLALHAISEVDGIVLDVGVSSEQLEQDDRGFSFLRGGPLDMRMSSAGLSAADLVNRLSEAELARVIAVYGEERRARSLAKAIVAARTQRPLARTEELADIVVGAVGVKRQSLLHPATRVFQALRILVNDELGELARGLYAAEQILKPGGRLGVITFHSLEDRLVKRFLQTRSKPLGSSLGVSRHQPAAVGPIQNQPASSFRLIFSRPRRPGKEELANNHRARSARLRAAERTSSEPFPAADPLEYAPTITVAIAHREPKALP